MNKHLVSVCCIFFLIMPLVTMADALKVGQNDTIISSLEKQKGKRVSVKLSSGVEMTGTVGVVNNSVMHLGALAGKEFFDAVINIDNIEAIVVRVK